MRTVTSTTVIAGRIVQTARRLGSLPLPSLSIVRRDPARGGPNWEVQFASTRDWYDRLSLTQRQALRFIVAAAQDRYQVDWGGEDNVRDADLARQVVHDVSG